MQDLPHIVHTVGLLLLSSMVSFEDQLCILLMGVVLHVVNFLLNCPVAQLVLAQMVYIFLFVLNTQIIKTQTARIPDLSTFVEANHPYDVPEVISMNVSHIFCRLSLVCSYSHLF